MQKCKFFMESMRITQGYGYKADGSVDSTKYSHVGSYALDLGGNDKTTRDWAYAPCDVVVKRVYGDYHAVWFETLEPVLCADGQARNLVFLLLHINTVDLKELDIKVGKVFKQGERFYREGVAGKATGNHIHMEVGEAPFKPTGWYKSNYRDNAGAYVWVINNQLKPHDIFILGDDVKVLNDGGYNWKKESDTSNDLTNLVDNSKWEDVSDLQYKVISKNCEFFTEANVNTPVGYLSNGTVYEITQKSTEKIGGFDWVKIKMVDGEYYAVILDGRCVIVDTVNTEIEAYKVENTMLKQQLETLTARNKELEATLAVYMKMYTDVALKVNDIQELLKVVG